jgi:hypothetical protein
VQVLNDISVGEFNRTMVAMSTWVAGTGNCAYCHNIANLASDTLPNGKPLYTKLVARRMLQMTRQINGQYSQHVKNTGVTCYTCHLGKPLPNGLWFYSTQTDYLRHYLDRDGARVITQQVTPTNMNRSSVKQTEWTYALMMSQSRSLGVNCTYCHNSRNFASWDESRPQRARRASCDRQEVRKRESDHTKVRADGGLDDGPIGCGAPGVACVACGAGVCAPGVSLCLCSATKLALPFLGAQRGRGACVWRAHAHALTVRCGCV